MRLRWAASCLMLAGCFLPAGQAGANRDSCVEWQLAVSNGAANEVSVWVSGEGPRRFLGTVGRATTRTWTIAARPDWIEVTDPLRGTARNVEANARYTNRRD